MPPRDLADVSFELYARGYANTYLEAARMATNEPKVVNALLRYHEQHPTRHEGDTASIEEWGAGDTGQSG